HGLLVYSDIPYNIQLSRDICFESKCPTIPPIYVPELVANLIIKCWDAQPERRPSSEQIYNEINAWNVDILDKKSTALVEQINRANEALSNSPPSSNAYSEATTHLSKRFKILSSKESKLKP
ncbi:11046_t:CDS:2, partial [Dentiscutata heterogama]